MSDVTTNGSEVITADIVHSTEPAMSTECLSFNEPSVAEGAPEVHVTIPEPGELAKPVQWQVPTRGKKRLAIVGFAPTWNMAPYDDLEVDIWACNEFYMLKPKRFDVLFDLHGRHELETKMRSKDHITWLQNSKIPIFMREHFKDIPNSIPYPRKMILEKYRKYFTNTISWQLALAIDMGYKEIGIYGVNMATEDEYVSQRPSVEYFIGIAEGKGIKVIIPDESDMCKSWFDYGFEDENLSILAKRLKHLLGESQQRRAQAQAIAEQNVAILHQATGAAGATEYIMKSFVYPNVSFNEKLKPKESTEG